MPFLHSYFEGQPFQDFFSSISKHLHIIFKILMSMAAQHSMLLSISSHLVYPSVLCGEHYSMTLTLQEVREETFCCAHTHTKKNNSRARLESRTIRHQSLCFKAWCLKVLQFYNWYSINMFSYDLFYSKWHLHCFSITVK